MTDLYIVIMKDRRSDTDAYPYSSEEAAVEAARNAVDLTDVNWEDSELTEGMIRSGWVFYLPYGPEGDSVRVVKRELDPT
jgi:hypothetical protein